jgi:hypothetical protein
MSSIATSRGEETPVFPKFGRPVMVVVFVVMRAQLRKVEESGLGTRED